MPSGWWRQPSLLQFIVNGFVRAGICQALNEWSSDDELDELLYEMDSSLEHKEVECTKTVESTQSSDEELYSNHSTYDQQDKDQNQSSAFDSPVIVLYSSAGEDV